MPCIHKFHEELELTQLDYKPDTLIVGTFEPMIDANGARWFFGRTANDHFWNVLPRVYGKPSLIDAEISDWKTFCREHKIAITGLVSSIDDADPDKKKHLEILLSFSDKAYAYHFDDFEFVGISGLLQRHPSIKNVYLTRGITEAFWRHAWNPVIRYCAQHDIRERRLFCPSESPAYQIEAYNKEHPQQQIASAEDYILMRWKEEWHF